MKNGKKILSVVLAVLMLCSVFVVAPISASAASHTQAEAVDWIKARANEGWWQDVDGAYGCQCVDLIKAYYQYWGYDTTRGNAWEYKSSHLPAGSDWYYSSTPVPGSVFVKDKDSTWTMGHVGLVYAVEGSTIYTVETNVASPYDGGKPYAKATYKSHPISYAVTFINPKFSNPVPVDTQAPTITNARVENVSGSSFTMKCTLSDNVGVTRVWLNIYGPSRQDGYAVAASNGEFTHTIKTADWGGSGDYTVHIYAFDAQGNQGSNAVNSIRAYNDTKNPVVTNARAENISAGSFTIKADLSDDVGVTRVWLNIYGPGKQDGYALSATSGAFSHTIKTSDWGGAGNYTVHIYAFDAQGNQGSNAVNSIKAYDDTQAPTISNARVENVSGNSFDINCTLSDNVGVTRVWLNIYGPTRQDGYAVAASNGEFTHTIKTADWGGAGNYTVHIYAFDAQGNETSAAVNSIRAYNPTEPVETQPATNAPTKEPTQTPTETQPITDNPTVPIENQPATDKPTEPVVTEPSKMDISTWTVDGLEDAEYTGKVIKPEFDVVSDDGEYADFNVKYKNNKNAGTATVTITGTGDYTGTIVKTFKITKADQPMTAKAVTKAVKSSVLKKSKVAVKGTITLKKAQGAVTYKKLSGSKYLTISKSGVITVKKGKYKKNTVLTANVKVTAKGSTNYKSGSKTVKVKIKIK